MPHSSHLYWLFLRLDNIHETDRQTGGKTSAAVATAAEASHVIIGIHVIKIANENNFNIVINGQTQIDMLWLQRRRRLLRRQQSMWVVSVSECHRN